MSSLKSFRSSGSMPLLALSAEFFLFSSALFIGIATMWQFLKRKISDEISACVTKIANDLSAHDTKINATFNAERGRMYAEINNKLTAEIGKIKARDDVLTKEAQKILSMVNNITTRLNTIEEACRNDFSAINASIENLQNEMIRQYAVARRIQPVETDQLSMADQSETSSQSHANSSGSSDSGPITFRGISLTVWTRFKQLFDQIRDEKGLNTEEICLLVAMEIRELGGKIKKNTIQGFYERNITKRGGYISTLDDIGLWVDSKNNENLDSNSE